MKYHTMINEMLMKFLYGKQGRRAASQPLAGIVGAAARPAPMKPRRRLYSGARMELLHRPFNWWWGNAPPRLIIRIQMKVRKRPT